MLCTVCRTVCALTDRSYTQLPTSTASLQEIDCHNVMIAITFNLIIIVTFSYVNMLKNIAKRIFFVRLRKQGFKISFIRRKSQQNELLTANVRLD